jgi:hypothetical protein
METWVVDIACPSHSIHVLDGPFHEVKKICFFCFPVFFPSKTTFIFLIFAFLFSFPKIHGKIFPQQSDLNRFN